MTSRKNNSDRDAAKNSSSKPTAKYGALSESLRHAISEKNACSLFCGGRKCKYCNAVTGGWKEEQMAIKGLFSSWVTEDLLAMSRPSTELLDKYAILDQFHQAKIKSIINLQKPGEHGSCGQPLETSGFSYVPQTFMDNDVFFYNFGWQDYGVGSLSNILDMVKVTQFAVSEGKVAIHCHAGLGRTGVLIACYLVYAHRMEADDAINYVRSKRDGAIQTKGQIECIQEFAKYIKPFRVVFSSVEPGAHDFNLSQYLTRQKHMLHGLEGQTLKYIPKIIYVVCERLLELAQRGRKQKKKKQMDRRDSVELTQQTAPGAFINTRSAAIHESSATPHTKRRPLTKSHSRSMDDVPSLSTRSRGKELKSQVDRHSCESLVSHSGDSDRDSSSYSGSDMFTVGEGTTDFVTHNTLPNGMAADPQVTRVVQAMGLPECDHTDEVRERVEEYKQAVNADDSTWTTLMDREQDAEVLTCLMWDWLDHLREPVLSTQDLPHLLSHSGDPQVALTRLQRGSRHTTEYLFQVVARLQPMPSQLELELIQRILSTLCQQNMVMVYDMVLSPSRSIVRRTSNLGEMKDELAMQLLNFVQRLLYSINTKLKKVREDPEGEDH